MFLFAREPLRGKFAVRLFQYWTDRSPGFAGEVFVQLPAVSKGVPHNFIFERTVARSRLGASILQLIGFPLFGGERTTSDWQDVREANDANEGVFEDRKERYFEAGEQPVLGDRNSDNGAHVDPGSAGDDEAEAQGEESDAVVDLPTNIQVPRKNRSFLD